MPETLERREEGVRHVLTAHDDHRALLLWLAKKFSMRPDDVRDEVIAEVKNLPTR